MIEPGKELLHYRLVEKIGEGGMGVVWKALDTHLEREVAVKILPEIFAGDAERLARFEREAKLLASLNHPNIAAVHGLDEDQGVRFLVMELVPGEDLSCRLQRGPLAVEEALRVGLQVSEALEVAHDNGVIHRDLKPANIQLTPTGDVKVLDFGLAKAFEVTGSSSDMSASPTVTSAGTMAGTILGTAAYMSPEQAHGRVADRRADIWSFGCVLYELLSGKQAFTGESISDTLASVLKFEPDHDTLPRDLPSRVRRLLVRCLAKRPKQRLQAIGEARIVLEECVAGETDEIDQPAATQPSPASRRRTWLWIGALAVTAVVALAAGRLLQSEPERPLRKLPIRAQGGLELDYNSKPLAISPNGRHIAFISERKLWIRDLKRFEATAIPGTEGATLPFWSPDGTLIGFARGQKLWKVAATGGSPVTITTLEESVGGGASGLAWLPNGKIVFCAGGSTIFEVSATGGDPRPIHEIDPETERDIHDVSPLPDGLGVLYMVHRNQGRDTLAVLSGGKQKIIFQAAGLETHQPVYSPSGHILFVRHGSNRGIWALPFSLAKLEVTGEPFLVAADVTLPSVSRDGTLVFVRGSTQETELTWFDASGNELETFGEMTLMWPFPAISPDGSRVAVAAADDDFSNWDIWVHDLERGTWSRITFAEDEQGSVAWTPDGKHIVYVARDEAQDLRLEIVPADASGEPRTLWDGDECRPIDNWENPHITPDGRFVAYASGAERQKNEDICLLELGVDDAKPVPFLHGPANELAPRFHPDGHYLAYQSAESGMDEIYVTSFPEAQGKWQVSVGGGVWPRWSADGSRLHYRRHGGEVMVVEVETEPALRLGTPSTLFTAELSGQDIGQNRPDGFSVSADNRFLFIRRAQRDRNARAAAGITLVENWFSEFRESR